ncbi:MAG: ribbon-helix-helix protein, CopG family, partial [Chloroflexi bacterium]|nr:ribbon-helix-helix protein, CopG family [Chloroflexota bacterium]
MVDEHRDPSESFDETTQEEQRGRKARFTEGIDTLVDEVNKVVRVAIVNSKTTAESIGDNIRDSVQGVRTNRDNVVMVRVDDESLGRVDELVEAGIVNSRSEAAALL